MRRHARAAVIGAVGFGLIGILVACGYLALPFGWTINFPGFSGDPLSESALARITVPPGFSIDTYAQGIPGARFMLFSAAGDLLVSAPRQGKVWLIARDAGGNGRADGQRVLLDNLYQPHGLAYRDGWLYVAETTAVLRVRFDPTTGAVSGENERIIRDLPDAGNHWTRTIHIGPDDKLYVSMGSSCNVCIESDKRRATIMRFNLDGSDAETYATGLRNSVDFDWQPGTGALYGTDNGRDLLGDDFPPDELNRIVDGGFYGWPFANGDRIPDPDFGANHVAEIALSTPPAHSFGAHVAPLGITFYEPPPGHPVAAFPPSYVGAAFVAQHGSWNRSKKSGYQVVVLHFHPDGSITEAPFASGFMVNEHVFARPVDVAVGPDGALYVSDDFTGSIYRIAYGRFAVGHIPAAAVTAAPARSTPDPLAALDPADLAAARARGEALWNAHPCASCHLHGVAPAEVVRPLSALRSKYTIDSLAAFLQTPPPPMPSFSFSDAERRDLAIYLLATFSN
jgi:glucose/arabinose dehydrogenase